jgi:hypothetical protein
MGVLSNRTHIIFNNLPLQVVFPVILILKVKFDTN